MLNESWFIVIGLLVLVTLIVSFIEIRKKDKERERVREDFTAMMVHELRAPLTVIRGTTDMFLVNPKLAEEPTGRELLVSMQNSTIAMLSLVGDLLDSAKIDAGKFQVNKTKINIQDLLTEREKFFSSLAKEKGIDLTLLIDKPLPDAVIDKERISQVLNNLLSNAIKYTVSGGQITLKAVTGDKKIRVEVIDTGVGIASNKIPLLFSKFKQLGQTSQGGTGLGLVVAKGIIEAHGGEIYVRSVLNSGSTFGFTLPIA